MKKNMQDNSDSQSQHCCKKQKKCACPNRKEMPDTSYYLLRSHFSKEIFYGYFNQEGLSANINVVCQSPYGLDILTIIGPATSCQQQGDAFPILRLANDQDHKKVQELEKKTSTFISIFRKKITQYADLGMKFVHARFLLDESKIVFFFTADQRIDFRDLVKELAAEIHSRVELWQINSREETRILGGLAVCGREYCCRTMGTCSGNISMKMLKDQSLSPNSTKLSGACGRLFCCLAYEHQQYIDEKKNLPKTGSVAIVDDERWQVKEVNIIARSLILVTQTGGRLNISADKLVYDAENKVWIPKALNPD